MDIQKIMDNSKSSKRDKMIQQWNSFQNDEGDIDYSAFKKNADKTYWHRFEDFIYFNDHDIFEGHASKRAGLVENRRWILAIRITFVIMTTIQAWILPMSQNLRSFKDAKFLTHWGSSLSWVTHILGLVLHFNTKQNENKYRFFNLWKWYTYFYQLIFIINIIVTIIFWTLLWHLIVGKKPFTTPLAIAALVGDHAVPIFCLTLDYILINTMTFAGRHFLIQIPLLAIYGVYNLRISLHQGYPVYAPLDWTQPSGQMMAAFVGIFFYLLSVMMKYITIYKIKRLGYDDMFEILNKRTS